MLQLDADIASSPPPISPLLLSDRLLNLAQQAESAGLKVAAEQLVSLAMAVLDQPIARKPGLGHHLWS